MTTSTTTIERRKIIRIEEEKCDGCGDCIPNCPEGAIRVIDGKARLVGELLCDGLGACLGHCPQGAITVEEREAAPYDERQVIANVLRQGRSVLDAHLQHLKDHHQTGYLTQAMDYLRENGIPLQMAEAKPPAHPPHSGNGCPGSRIMSFEPRLAAKSGTQGEVPSQLRHWPIQLHLLNPGAPHYQGSDLLLAADCVPFAVGDFHQRFLRGRTLAIACPKLDEGQETYVQKLKSLIEGAEVNTITVIIMQVPCCQGLLRLAQTAASQASRKVPIKSVIISLQGEVLRETWV